ncbi:hypothetical protein MPSEU_000886800 [Mayamaea pseudoterrestris]|nr:hypothetical protein MPSEU_000886800 [Mayamaea pseudoterrestris]
MSRHFQISPPSQINRSLTLDDPESSFRLDILPTMVTVVKESMPISAYASVKRMMPIIVTGWIVLTACYLFFLHWFRDSITIFGMKPSAEYCVKQDIDTCKRPDLFAFQLVSGVALTLCGIVGFYTWHVTGRSHSALPNTAAGRLFDYLPEAELLAALNFMFQAWDFVISLSIPEHATPIMLAHHLMASAVAWCSIRYQCLHYYGVFFLGLTEVSSFFLVFIDLSKYYPSVPGSWLDTWVGGICGPCFALTFFYYRVWLWWPESMRLFRDVQEVARSGQAQKLRPQGTWVLYLFLVLNVPLGILQLYWFTIILEEAKKVVLGQ